MVDISALWDRLSVRIDPDLLVEASRFLVVSVSDVVAGVCAVEAPVCVVVPGGRTWLRRHPGFTHRACAHPTPWTQRG